MPIIIFFKSANVPVYLCTVNDFQFATRKTMPLAICALFLVKIVGKVRIELTLSQYHTSKVLFAQLNFTTSAKL